MQDYWVVMEDTLGISCDRKESVGIFFFGNTEKVTKTRHRRIPDCWFFS